MRLESAAANKETARIVTPRLVLDRRHSPVAKCLAVEKRFKTCIRDKRGWRDDLITCPPRDRDAGKHRIRRTDTWKQTRPCGIEILGMMEATVGVSNALC